MPTETPPQTDRIRAKDWLLSADFVAGLTVASILLPEAVAYAGIAHLPIQHAIVAVLVGLLCYALVGSSAYAIVSPTSSSAALMAAVVLSLHTGHQHSIDLNFALVILTGVGLLVLAKAGLGRLSAFISRPVLHGFSFALALTIIIKQLPILFGIEVHATESYQIVLALIDQAQTGSVWSTGIGLCSLVLLVLIKRWPVIPGAFVVLLLGIAISASIDLSRYQVALVGSVHLQPPHLQVPQLSIEEWLDLAELACGLIIIIVAESWGSIRSLSLLHGETVEPNRELRALGSANLVSGLFQGMPVGAGFSVCTANEQAGAQSKWAGGFAALLMLLTVVFAQHWIALIPEAIVAAAVIHALSHSLNPKSLIYLWQINRDQYLAIAAVFAVLAFGVLHGMLIAVGLSLASAIRAFSQPLVRELAELDDSRDYVDRQNHPSAKVHPNILILRPEEPLFFASVEGILAEVHRRVHSAQVHYVIISLEETADLDSTAAECLMELTRTLALEKNVLLLARVKDPIRFLLEEMALPLFQDRLFWSVADAVASVRT